LLLSLGVALTGITVPIGLSYTLQGLLDATPVQAFAAGAALCSTSLGTTFAVLKSSGLSASRLGVVLTSAAMMDDVVGLVMVQVISNLGGDNFSWVTVVRPVLVSVAFALCAPVACLFIVKPVTLALNRYREAHPAAKLDNLLRKGQAAFVTHTMLLIALVAGATYAGTSNLFAAYIAGATISWWDTELPHPVTRMQDAETGDKSKNNVTAGTGPLMGGSDSNTSEVPSPQSGKKEQPLSSTTTQSLDTSSGAAVYELYYSEAVSKILQPLFFASIGFSIPITRMFSGAIVWRGIIYAVLMALAKLVCGLCLVRLSPNPSASQSIVSRLLARLKAVTVPHLWGKSKGATTVPARPAEPSAAATSIDSASLEASNPRNMPNPPKPFSLHPPLILALAMCARGEIGFLISGVAESNGIFSPTGEASEAPSDLFLVVTWAIVICTIFGPLGVGLSVRRVKKLQKRKDMQQEGAGRDVLGVWGVE
jgi:Kef-type K+ transport system membrane component KefB